MSTFQDLKRAFPSGRPEISKAALSISSPIALDQSCSGFLESMLKLLRLTSTSPAAVPRLAGPNIASVPVVAADAFRGFWKSFRSQHLKGGSP